jgi:uncharacterized membrane protein
VVRLLLTLDFDEATSRMKGTGSYMPTTSTLHAWSSGLERILLSHKQTKHRMHLLQVIFGNLLQEQSTVVFSLYFSYCEQTTLGLVSRGGFGELFFSPSFSAIVDLFVLYLLSIQLKIEI